MVLDAKCAVASAIPPPAAAVALPPSSPHPDGEAAHSTSQREVSIHEFRDQGSDCLRLKANRTDDEKRFGESLRTLRIAHLGGQASGALQPRWHPGTRRPLQVSRHPHQRVDVPSRLL